MKAEEEWLLIQTIGKDKQNKEDAREIKRELRRQSDLEFLKKATSGRLSV